MTINEEISAFLDRHHLDSFYDIGGCETCGPDYEWNCSCGVSGSYAGSFVEHQREYAITWIGTGPEITKDRD